MLRIRDVCVCAMRSPLELATILIPARIEKSAGYFLVESLQGLPIMAR